MKNVDDFVPLRARRYGSCLSPSGIHVTWFPALATHSLDLDKELFRSWHPSFSLSFIQPLRAFFTQSVSRISPTDQNNATTNHDVIVPEQPH